MTTKPKPQLNRSTFWDTDYDAIDFDKQAKAVIKRVFEYGSWDEILQITVYYGEEKIKASLFNTQALRFRCITFASLILNIPQTDFYSFKNRPTYLP